MLKTRFDVSEQLNILCLGSHSDDIEIGCGGTILRLLTSFEHMSVCWVVFSGEHLRGREAIESASSLLERAQDKTIIVNDFRDGFFPFIGAEIKEYFEQLKQAYAPDVVFTHYRDDRHQDHRLISDLTWNTFRDHTILEYEIPKYDGDLGTPNFYVHLDESICLRKIRHILSSFRTQEEKQWFTEDTLLSLLRLRGIESNAPGRYAEAFYARKMVW